MSRRTELIVDVEEGEPFFPSSDAEREFSCVEVRIVTKPAFVVIGIEGSGPADKRPAWIKRLWDRSLSGIGEIRDLNVGEGWGLMSAIDEPFARWKE